MATQALCGYAGTVTGVAGGEIKEWNISLVNDAPEATSFESDGWKEFVPCLVSGSGSFKSNMPAEVGATSGQFEDGGSGITISGDIIITKITDTTPVDGIVTFNQDFVFTGKITCSSLID